ncbi:D-amino-acid dehydrogenase [Terribacillus halophilus]|uniref:D-amino-acid dehydrogenase n=1 Tax=Terribacillus halophilus TaxID=361279 RepID=A0A1G6RFF2_9BACI|nr:FAD-dependent oxidoreductase [Terribacillus halophilus]SDD03034.1 D-amino-acid dehydrogenase [Terribacillus halophilus]
MHIAIIGAGIAGSVTAYKLAKAGMQVTVVDRFDDGQATDAAAGIVCPWLSQRRNKDWYQLAKGGARYYPEIIEELRLDGEEETGYARVGALSLHQDSKKLDAMQDRAEKRKADAPEIGTITRLDEEDARNLFPLLAPGYGAVHVSGAARVDGRALRNSLHRAAKKYNARFIAAEAHLSMREGAIVVTAGDEEWTPDQVAVTAGAWTKQLLAPLDYNMQVSFQKAQICHLQLQDRMTDEWPVIMPPNDQYLLAFPDGRIVAGATHENDTEMDTSITAGGVHEVLTKAMQLAPGLAEAGLTETRVGFRPFTPGFLPVFGRMPQHQNLYVMNGLGASGLTMGPFVAYQLTKLMLGQETDINISAYNPEGALA